MDDDGRTDYAVAQPSSRMDEDDPPFASAGGHRTLNTVRRTSNPNRGVGVDGVLNCWKLAKESTSVGVRPKP